MHELGNVGRAEQLHGAVVGQINGSLAEHAQAHAGAGKSIAAFTDRQQFTQMFGAHRGRFPAFGTDEGDAAAFLNLKIGWAIIQTRHHKALLTQRFLYQN